MIYDQQWIQWVPILLAAGFEDRGKIIHIHSANSLTDSFWPYSTLSRKHGRITVSGLPISIPTLLTHVPHQMWFENTHQLAPVRAFTLLVFYLHPEIYCPPDQPAALEELRSNPVRSSEHLAQSASCRHGSQCPGPFLVAETTLTSCGQEFCLPHASQAKATPKPAKRSPSQPYRWEKSCVDLPVGGSWSSRTTK